MDYMIGPSDLKLHGSDESLSSIRLEIPNEERCCQR
jgi:hypothetical protein